MSNSRFFEPYKGSHYEEGIQGKKILILGASFYCNLDPRNPCPYFKECTSDTSMDSSPFDYKCKGYVLHNYPTDSINENEKVRSIRNFCQFLSKYTNKNSDPWAYVAFTNYVQYMLGHVATYKKNIKERDFKSLKESIVELKPDIIVTWGVIVQNAIREWHKDYIVDYNEMFTKNEGWLGHLKIEEYGKKLPILFSWHPSSSKWYSDIDYVHKYFEKALKE